MRDVKGKVAFITGGASGCGLGMARVFVDAGMKVAIADMAVIAVVVIEEVVATEEVVAIAEAVATETDNRTN